MCRGGRDVVGCSVVVEIPRKAGYRCADRGCCRGGEPYGIAGSTRRTRAVCERSRGSAYFNRVGFRHNTAIGKGQRERYDFIARGGKCVVWVLSCRVC